MTVEPFKLSKNVCLGEVTIDDTYRIINIQRGHPVATGVFDGLHMSWGDIASCTYQGKLFHIPSHTPDSELSAYSHRLSPDDKLSIVTKLTSTVDYQFRLFDNYVVIKFLVQDSSSLAIPNWVQCANRVLVGHGLYWFFNSIFNCSISDLSASYSSIFRCKNLTEMRALASMPLGVSP